MPGLTVATDARPAPAPATAAGASAAPRRVSASSCSPSPTRPPVSPITPTLSPARLPATGRAGRATSTTEIPPPTTATSQSALPDFAQGRPVFTHTSQTEQVAAAPPPAEPIDFDSNPDVLALKSAISILQLQRARATADIQTLGRARDSALADPAAFIADLQSGRIRVEGDRLMSSAPPPTVPDSDSDSSSEDGDDDDEADDSEQPNKQKDTPDSETKPSTDGDTPMADGPNPSTTTKPKQPRSKKGKQNQPPSTTTTTTAPPAWLNLPKPQTLVRCPPINWAQYGVVGDSLEKLHAEQVAAPTPGAPAVLGPGGTYEFKAGEQAATAGAGEQGRRLVGVAAPFSPLRDRVGGKKGGRR